jgi:hypothetical protein
MSEAPQPIPGQPADAITQPGEQPPYAVPPQFGQVPTPPPGYGPYPGYPYPLAAPPQKNSMAVTALVLGIVGLCTSLFYVGGVIGVVGLIFSIIGLRSAKRMGGAGKGMAIGGLVTSIVAIILNVAEIVVIVFLVHSASNCAQYSHDPDHTQFNQCITQNFSNLGN